MPRQTGPLPYLGVLGLSISCCGCMDACRTVGGLLVAGYIDIVRPPLVCTDATGYTTTGSCYQQPVVVDPASGWRADCCRSVHGFSLSVP